MEAATHINISVLLSLFLPSPIQSHISLAACSVRLGEEWAESRERER